MKKVAGLWLVVAMMMLGAVTSLAPVTGLAQNNKTPASNTQQTAQKTLYQRLGGYDALAAVVEDFISRMAGDPQLKRFFGGLSTDSRRRLRNHVVDFLCVGTGGPCIYTGREMETVHTGLNITDADWEIAVKHLVASLEKFKVPAQEKQEVLTAIGSLKPKIVNR